MVDGPMLMPKLCQVKEEANWHRLRPHRLYGNAAVFRLGCQLRGSATLLGLSDFLKSLRISPHVMKLRKGIK
jgi:hypothetical protein